MTAAWYSQSGCVSRKSAWACEYSFIKVLIVAFYFSFVRIDIFVCEDVGHKIGANLSLTATRLYFKGHMILKTETL
jgi:hypothetical protein